MKIGKPPDINVDVDARRHWMYLTSLAFRIVRARHGSPQTWLESGEFQERMDDSQREWIGIARVMFREETDRGCMLFGMAMLELDVDRLLVAHTSTKILSVARSAEPRRQLARELNLISEPEAADLRRLAKARNAFAHEVGFASFESLRAGQTAKERSVRDALRQLELDPLQDFSNLRYRVCRVVGILAARLGERRRCLDDGTFRRPEDCPWPIAEAEHSRHSWAEACQIVP